LRKKKKEGRDSPVSLFYLTSKGEGKVRRTPTWTNERERATKDPAAGGGKKKGAHRRDRRGRRKRFEKKRRGPRNQRKKKRKVTRQSPSREKRGGKKGKSPRPPSTSPSKGSKREIDALKKGNAAPGERPKKKKRRNPSLLSWVSGGKN